METNNNRLQELYQRFLNRQCSPEEVKELAMYFKADGPQLQELIRAELGKPVDAAPEDQVILNRVEDQLMLSIAQYLRQEEETAPIRRSYFLPIAIAASVLLFVMLGYLNKTALYNWISPVRYTTVYTKPGERKQLTLIDGTQIWLSAASSLKYPDQFRGETRLIELNGEAFFEVAHDKSHPFIVHTAKLDTRVLGTSFDLQAYADQVDINVTLLTGKVRVTAINQRTTDLTPNQQAVFNTGDGSLNKTVYPGVSAYLDRRDGNLKYKNTPLPTVVRDLQRTFNVSIKLDDRMKNCVFFGSFRSTDRIATVMQKLVIPYGAHLKQEGSNSFTIIGKACK